MTAYPPAAFDFTEQTSLGCMRTLEPLCAFCESPEDVLESEENGQSFTAICSELSESEVLVLLPQVVESILDDDNDMQDMYLGRRAAVEAMASHPVRALGYTITTWAKDISL